jgi:membrane protein YdbS with pleckstrin-like domain
MADDEKVLVDLRPHWIFLSGPLLATALGVAAAIAVVVCFPGAPVAVAWVLVAGVLVPVLWLAGRTLRWSRINLTVTTQRLVLRRGIVSRDLRQLRLQRITEVHSHQTVFERIVGAGRLVVELQGESQQITVDDVRRPRSLQRLLTSRLDALARLGWEGAQPAGGRGTGPAVVAPTGGAWAGEPTPAHGVRLGGSGGLAQIDTSNTTMAGGASGATSVPEQLIQLDNLRRRGIVTTAEFEAKKAELLDRL